MLSTVTNQPHRRGHAHKRSAAISGDFDMDFFRSPPSNQIISQHSHSQSQSLPKDSFLNTGTTPQLVITDVTEKSHSTSPSRSRSTNKEHTIKHNSSNISSTPSPQKKHTRLNSWAHSFMKPKKNEFNDNNKHNDKIEYNSSSSNEATPDKSLYTSQFTYNTKLNDQYQVPEALIDLDLASGIFHDPSSNVPKKKFIHRRTESAPELEDFLKYKVFSFNQANSSVQQNPAIFEEEEEEEEEENDEDAISSTSSNNNMSSNMKNNISANSLNSYPSFKLQSPAPVQNNDASITSTPVSLKTNATQQSQTRRGGATAARYQSYYNNSLLLSNALKSSESLSQISNGANSISNKASISSFTNAKSVLSSTSSANSSILNSPSRFKFESKVYDPPSQSTTATTNFALLSPSSPTLSSTSASSYKNNNNHQPSSLQVESPSKGSKKLYIHKKSNSLLSSISLRMRRNSTSSRASDEYRQHEVDEDEDIGDSTLTPLNFGEPGPELDLTTMTPKIHISDANMHQINSNSNNNVNNQINYNNTSTNMSSPIHSKSPSKGHHHHSKKFFSWLKK